MVKSFSTTVATPRKCPGRCAPQSGCGELLDRHERLRARRIDLAHVGGEEHVRPGAGEQRAVALEVTGIAGEVVGAIELRRVHEDRRDDAIGVTAGELDQRQVPLVQRAHGRHERDAQAVAAAHLAAPRLHRAHLVDRPHVVAPLAPP